MGGIDTKGGADRFAAEYVGWDKGRLETEQRRLEAKSRERLPEKKLQNIADRLAAIRAALANAGHVQPGPTPPALTRGVAPTAAPQAAAPKVAPPPPSRAPTLKSPPPAPAAPAQGRGPMGPVGVELDQLLAE